MTGLNIRFQYRTDHCLMVKKDDSQDLLLITFKTISLQTLRIRLVPVKGLKWLWEKMHLALFMKSWETCRKSRTSKPLPNRTFLKAKTRKATISHLLISTLQFTSIPAGKSSTFTPTVHLCKTRQSWSTQAHKSTTLKATFTIENPFHLPKTLGTTLTTTKTPVLEHTM